MSARKKGGGKNRVAFNPLLNTKKKMTLDHIEQVSKKGMAAAFHIMQSYSTKKYGEFLQFCYELEELVIKTHKAGLAEPHEYNAGLAAFKALMLNTQDIVKHQNDKEQPLNFCENKLQNAINWYVILADKLTVGQFNTFSECATRRLNKDLGLIKK